MKCSEVFKFSGKARKRAVLKFATLFFISVSTATFAAGKFPDHPVRIVVPYPAGGGSDVAARLLAEKLQSKWGQPVIVDNRPGAGGNIGTDYVYRSRPDGYTVLLTANPPLVSNQYLYSKLPFDPEKFAPITVMANMNGFLLINPALNFNNVDELIAYAKANPGKLNYASQGIGNAAHLNAEYLSILAGIRMTHIPYAGTAPALTALASGQVDLMFTELVSALPLIRAGKLKVLGAGADEPSPLLPNAPLISKSVPSFNASVWTGLVAPPGTPQVIADEWADAITEVLAMPDVRARLRDLDFIPAGGTPEKMDKFMKQDRAKWRLIISKSGAKAQ